MKTIYRLYLLGTIRVEKDGVFLRDFESRKALALLGYLARQDQPVSRSYLAGLFWGSKEEARGRRNLSRELSQLSAQLLDCFQADYHTVQFQPPDNYWVDTYAFADLVKSCPEKSQARSTVKLHPEAPKTALDWFPAHLADGIQPEQLAEAVALYRGDFMSGYFLDDCPEFETWLIREQENWRRQITELLERLIVYHARSDQDDQALTYARRWLELEPWRERAHRYLMVLLACQDERTAALAQYEICRRALAQELAVEPSAETVALYEQLRAGELSLLPVARPHPAFNAGVSVVQAVPADKAEVTADPLHSASPVPLYRLRLPTPATPFIGREEELAQIAAHLADPACRLLTLVGLGGIGKTRLAIQSAWQAKDLSPEANGQVAGAKLFADGVYFIPLDSLSSAEFLISTLADALSFSFYSGTNPTNQLLDYLREKRLLLVLDNFEHLLAGADLVANILKQAHQVKILAISRERLNLQEEYLLPIQGLKVPDASLISHELRSDTTLPRRLKGQAAFTDYSAVQLFLQRAQTVQPGYALSDTEKPCVLRICHLTEGTPLAIELAAAWLRLLSCPEIVREIEHNLDFLTTALRNVPERQRSLRAVFDYSWQLLSAEERRVFRQLAVFRGGFQLDAAKQVTGASMPLLLALIDKSLLHRTETGRFTRHLLLWQYAAEKLDAAPQEKEKIQDLYCAYYAAFLHDRETRLKGGQQREALAEISLEIENVRRSWHWAIAQVNTAAIEQALESLFHFYDVRSWFQEGAEVFGWASDSLARAHGFSPLTDQVNGQSGSSVAENQVPGQPQAQSSKLKAQILLGKLLARQGWFTFQLGQHEPARALLQVSLTILRQVGAAARGEMVFSLNYLGAVHRHLGEYEAAQAYLQESLAICREVDDTFGLTIALNILSQVAYLEGDYDRARRLCQESLALKQAIGDRRGMTFSFNNLGQVASALGEYPAAKDFFEKSLAICQAIDDRRGIALCLSYLGDVVQMMGEAQGAKQLYQESLTIFKEIGNQWGAISARTKLGYVVGELGESEAAREYFSQALKMAMDIQAMPGVMDALVGLAALLIKAGAIKLEQALEILTLVLSHAASSRDNQERATQLLAELEPQLPAGLVKTRQTKGRSSTLEIVVKVLSGQGKG